MIKDNKKILVLVPASSALGGINSYYSSLKPLYSLPVEYLYRGSRIQPFKERFLVRVKRILIDLFNYTNIIRKGNIILIHLNTSLSVKSALRDGIYIALAKIFNIKCIIFFRGWDIEQAKLIKRYHMFWFKPLFLSVDSIITLTSASKNLLINWGYRNKIYIETTLVDYNLVKNYNITMMNKIRMANEFRILFLSRLQKEKGIYELIDAFNILQRKYNNIKLIIAGSGTEENNIRILFSPNNDIELIGFVRGEQKSKVLASSNIFVLPSYTEGMPNSVLEAMAFALPIICSNVGALPEIITDGINGYILDKINSQFIADKIELLYLNKDLAEQISYNNYYSSKRFYSTQVIKRLEDIYNDIII